MATLHTTSRAPLGWWTGRACELVTHPGQLAPQIARIRRPLYLLDKGGALAWADEGTIELGARSGSGAASGLVLRGAVGPVLPERMGGGSFTRDHGLRYPYVAGAMANGIASTELVEAMARAGMLAFFGAAGLAPARVEDAIDRLSTQLGALPHGFNLIHSPQEPALEHALVDLYLRRGVRLVSASAWLDVGLALVRYRVAGLRADATGRVEPCNRIVAKVSRVEVARKFMAPPPHALLAQLVASGEISAEQAAMAATVPLAQDVTVEADSGGHTDNRPALALVPTMIALRDRMQAEHRYEAPLRIGAAGGIATPHAVAAAFAMGADYVLTGSINQACVEAGTSDAVRRMLAAAEQADVAMAPAADMFELGVQLQVLKRGTMFAMRARKLHELYRRYGGLSELPASERESLEHTLFRQSLDQVWEQTERFWHERDPGQIDRARRDPKHQMALVFRWYLGMSSRWANRGEPGREIDYQVWCGPSMGAFNEWARGSFLEDPARRRVVDIALALLHGAAVITRANALRQQGIELAPDDVDVAPRDPDRLAREAAA